MAQSTFPISSAVLMCFAVPQATNLPTLDLCLSLKQSGRNLWEDKAQLAHSWDVLGTGSQT